MHLVFSRRCDKKKITKSLFLHRLRDRLKTIHRPGVNRFDCVILWYDFEYKNKSGDYTTKLRRIDGINFRAEAKMIYT